MPKSLYRRYFPVLLVTLLTVSLVALGSVFLQKRGEFTAAADREAEHQEVLSDVGRDSPAMPSPTPTPQVVGIRDPSVIITTASATIGLLSDMKVLPDGTVAATDVLQNSILFVHPGGETSTIGRTGAGPGELSAPAALAVLTDSLAVWDTRNSRIQILSRHGEYLRSFPVSMADGTSPAWRDDGWMAAPTMGMVPGLVRVRNPAGREIAIVGELLSPGSAIVHMGAAIDDIRNERVPAFVRNAARTVWDFDGRLWIVPEADTRLLRVALDGTVELDIEVEDTALEQIRGAYFEGARELAERGAVRPLRLYADAEAVEGGDLAATLA